MSGRPCVVVHIGGEKTGSTALQGRLSTQAKALDVVGFRYAHLGPDPNHHVVAAYVADALPQQDIHRWHGVTPENQGALGARIETALGAQLTADRTLILSSEHLSSRPRTVREVARLGDLLERLGADVWIVALIRRQDTFAESTYSTAVTAGRPPRFDAEEVIRARHRYDHATMLRPWHAVFADRVAVRVYREEWKTNREGLPRAFCDLAGIPWSSEWVLAGEAANASLDREALRVLGLLNSTRTHRRPALDRLRREFVRRASAEPVGRPPRFTVSDRRRIMDAYRASNEAVAACLPADDALHLLGPAWAPEPPLAGAMRSWGRAGRLLAESAAFDVRVRLSQRLRKGSSASTSTTVSGGSSQ